MSRKKKTPPAKRREQEKLRRINAPEIKEQRKAEIEAAKARAREAMLESEQQTQTPPVPENQDAGPNEAIKLAMSGQDLTPEATVDIKKPAALAPKPAAYGRYSAMRFTDIGDAGGQCRNYDVTLPSRADIKSLFDLIRKDRSEEHGVVYISTNLAEAGPDNYQLSYEYANNIFTRREKTSKRKNVTTLADLLDAPITKIKASGGWGIMNYFVNIYASGLEPENNHAEN